MLTAEEIDFWDGLIERSGDLDLARKFYPKAGRPQRVKEVFRSAARGLAHHDILLQEKFEQGAYRPELTDDEVRQIAADSLREDVKKGYLGEIFRKLDFPVYSTTNLSEQELGSLVNKVLREGAQGFSPGKNPREFAKGLVEFPAMHECPEEVSFTYAVFDDKRYQRFVNPRLARNVVTLKVFHNILLGRFGEASEVISKHSQSYDRILAQRLVRDFIDNESFTEENYSLEYLVAAQRSAFGDLFPQDIDKRIKQRAKKFDDYVEQHKAKIPKKVNIKQARENHLAGYKRLALARNIANYLDGRGEVTSTTEMDKAVSTFGNEYVKQQYAKKRGLPYEKTTTQLDADELNRAFDEAEDEIGILVGMRVLGELLSNQEYVAAVGKEKVREILNERTTRAMQNGKAHVVYALRFGTNLSQGHRHPAVPHFDEYVNVDRSSLLESMVSVVDWDPEHLLSSKYNFRCDNLTFFGTSEVDDAYELYQAIQQDGGRLPSAESMRKLVFLKMAMHVKEHYEGSGMRAVVDVFENPANSKYINPDQTRRLLTKLFTDYWEKGRVDGFMEAEAVPYFYALVSSKLGTLVKDDQRLDPYFKLHQFLEAQ